MKVTLQTSPACIKDMERFAAIAALTCRGNADNMNKEGYKPSDTLRNIIKLKHESILEHITLTYNVKGLSRACLHELERHRHISLSVESTRHTLHKYMAMSDNEIVAFFDEYIATLPIDKELVSMYCGKILKTLKNMHDVNPDMPNDKLKYFLPEFWPTNLILTSNIRELRHILKLRTAPATLNEFRVLAYSLFAAVPEEFRYLLEDCVYKEETKNAN